MNKKNIITVIIAFVIGILIGNLIQIPKNSDKLVGTIMNNQSRIKIVTDRAEVFHADPKGNPMGDVIGFYDKITIWEVFDGSNNQTTEKLVTCQINYKFIDFANTDFHKLILYQNTTDSDGYPFEQYIESKIISKNNNSFTLKYTPEMIENYEGTGTPINDFSDYFLEYDNYKLALGEITTTEN